MQKQEIVDTVHKDFVDSMYQQFGLQLHPGYCRIVLRPMFQDGGLSLYPPEIRLNSWKPHETEEGYSDKSVDTVCHESGHFLHPYARQFDSKEQIEKIGKKNIHLCEIVADLGSLIYLAERYGAERAKMYFERNHEKFYSTEVAQDLFLCDPSILGRIAHLDIRYANRIIRPLLDRPLYPENNKLSQSYLKKQKNRNV